MLWNMSGVSMLSAGERPSCGASWMSWEWVRGWWPLVGGKGGAFSLRPHPSGTAEVPCRLVHRDVRAGSVSGLPGRRLSAPFAAAWRAGVSRSERQSQQEPGSRAGSMASGSPASLPGDRTSSGGGMCIGVAHDIGFHFPPCCLVPPDLPLMSAGDTAGS